jgi:two-component system OmpR family response regulator
MICYYSNEVIRNLIKVKKTILIVEDDKALAEVLKYSLVKEGYEASVVFDGPQALEIARKEQPDLVILDIMLPGMDGYEVCRILRNEMTMPIMMLTAKDEEIDKIVGIEIGADDYMTKPFSMRELLARVRAMFRRIELIGLKLKTNEKVIVINGLRIEVDQRKVSAGGSPLVLNPKEFDLLVFLAKHKGIVFSREQLLDKVWGYDYAGDTRTVDVHVRWLRKKIEVDPIKPRYLISVRGVGYKLEG